MKKTYQMRKYFDCQDMPDSIMATFFEYHERGNDVVIDYYVDDPEDVVDQWLIENGAVVGEAVLVAHWW